MLQAAKLGVTWTVFVVLGVACGGERTVVTPPPPAPPVVPPKIVSIALSLADSLVLVTQPIAATTVVRDADGGSAGGRALHWASSDTMIATVSATGLITGRTVGFATITADGDGTRGSLPIAVAFGAPAAIVAPGADTLRSIAGDEAFGLPTIYVVDNAGKPVPGVLVAARTDSDAGTIELSTPRTDASGGILVRRWIPGTRAGKQRAVVTAKGLSRDLFVTVRAAAPASVAFVGGADQDAAPGARLPEPVVVRISDAYGNSVSGMSVSFDANGENIGTLTPATAVSDTAGRAATLWQLPNRLPAPLSLSIRVAGLPSLTAHALILGFTAKMVSVGIDHTCAIDLTDRIWCWGENANGELGLDPKLLDRSSRPMLLPTELRFVSVSASEWATCAIATDDHTYCWGNNAAGQLGDPLLAQSRGIAPIPIADVRFTQISMQFAVPNCAVTSNGELYCWGRGIDAVWQRVVLPEAITQVTGRTCALGVSRTIYCWGTDRYGPSPDPGFFLATAPHLTPTPVPTPEPMARLASGMISSPGPCAISVSAQLYCRRIVQTGPDSAQYPLDALIALDGPVVDAGNGYAGFSCAVTAKGSLYCWARGNSGGFLGTGDLLPRTTPAEITRGRFAATRVSTGYLGACALDKHSQVWCWGTTNDASLRGKPPVLAPTLMIP